jgi:hypothetical protein
MIDMLVADLAKDNQVLELEEKDHHTSFAAHTVSLCKCIYRER